jgi:hypothetical protein
MLNLFAESADRERICTLIHIMIPPLSVILRGKGWATESSPCGSLAILLPYPEDDEEEEEEWEIGYWRPDDEQEQGLRVFIELSTLPLSCFPFSSALFSFYRGHRRRRVTGAVARRK